MGRDNGADGWCILRCAGPRTIKVVDSLKAAGFEAWTPIEVVKRRAPGGRSGKVERHLALTPTIAFARVGHLDDLLAVSRSPTSRHPRFSVFRYYGAYPILANREIERLRLAERKSLPKEQRRTYAAGSTVTPTDGPYQGLSGIVQRSDGRYTMVAFGGWMDVQIETFALRPDEVKALETV